MTRNTETYDQTMYSAPNSKVGERLDVDELLDSVEEEDDNPVVDAVASVVTRAYLRFTA